MDDFHLLFQKIQNEMGANRLERKTKRNSLGLLKMHKRKSRKMAEKVNQEKKKLKNTRNRNKAFIINKE